MKIAYDFNSETWETDGILWLENVLSNKYKGIVIDCGLTPKNLKVLQELGVTVYKLISRFNILEFDKYYTLSSDMEDEIVLFAKKDFKQIEDNDKLVCGLEDTKLSFNPIVNLRTRMDFSDQINKEIVEKYKSPLSSRWIGGNKFAWNSFIAYYYVLLYNRVVELKDNLCQLVLNLYASQNKALVDILARKI